MFSDQLSAIGYQLSAFSFQPSAFSYQLSAIRPLVCRPDSES